MPIFDYSCENCGKKVEKIVKYELRKDPVPCTDCRRGYLRFQEKIHKAGFQLKGNGWFKSGGY